MCEREVRCQVAQALPSCSPGVHRCIVAKVTCVCRSPRHAAIIVDGMQIGYEVTQGADIAITGAAVRYFKGYGAVFSVGFNAAGGSKAIARAANPGGMARNCGLQNGMYHP